MTRSIAEIESDLVRTVEAIGFCQEHGLILKHETRAEELRKELKEARAAIRAVSGWQPIETAPKDGRPIIVYMPWNGLVRTAHYKPNHRRPEQPWCVHWDNTNKTQAGSPSLWMPLPPVPLT